MIEFFFAGLPIAVLVGANDKAESVAGSDRVSSGGSLCFSCASHLFPRRSAPPECGRGRGTSGSPNANFHRFWGHFLLRCLRKVRRHECPPGVAPRYLQQPRGPTHVGRLGFRFPDRRRLRIRHSSGLGSTDPRRAWFPGSPSIIAVSDFQCHSDGVRCGGDADLVWFRAPSAGAT